MRHLLTREPTRRAVITCAVASLAVGTRAAETPTRRLLAREPPWRHPGVLEAARRRSSLAGTAADVWSFHENPAGPVVAVGLGDDVQVTLANQVDWPLSLHWVGVRIANAMDGVGGLTQPPVPAGGRFDYRFTPPDSGTFLFRPCVPTRPLGPPGGSLNGVMIVAEREALPIEQDFVVLARAFRLDTAGHLIEPDAAGRTVLDGGLSRATLRQGARARVRFVNASAATLMIANVEPATSVSIVAIDSQPCEPFTPARGTIPIAPGARFDMLIEVPRSAGATARITVRDGLDGTAPTVPVVELRADDRVAPPRPAPIALPRNPRLPEAITLERAARADLVFAPPISNSRRRTARTPRAARVVLAAGRLAEKPALSVKLGTPISFGLVNPSDRPLCFHVHGHTMRVLHDLDDGWHPYWRDTVLIEPGKTHHVAFLADNPGKWLVSAQALGASGPASRGFTWYEVRP